MKIIDKVYSQEELKILRSQIEYMRSLDNESAIRQIKESVKSRFEMPEEKKASIDAD